MLSKKNRQVTHLYCLYGDAGIGKTTLASRMGKKPAFICFEDGLSSLNNDVDFVATDVIKSFMDFCEEMDEIAPRKIINGKKKGARKMSKELDVDILIFDGFDSIEALINDYICKKHDVANLNKGSFGEYYIEAREQFATVIDSLKELSKSINIVLISHSVKIDETASTGEEYRKSTINISQKLLIDFLGTCDLVGYLCSPVNIIDKDNKIINSMFQRKIIINECVYAHCKTRINAFTKGEMTTDEFISEFKSIRKSTTDKATKQPQTA